MDRSFNTAQSSPLVVLLRERKEVISETADRAVMIFFLMTMKKEKRLQKTLRLFVEVNWV